MWSSPASCTHGPPVPLPKQIEVFLCKVAERGGGGWVLFPEPFLVLLTLIFRALTRGSLLQRQPPPWHSLPRRGGVTQKPPHSHLQSRCDSACSLGALCLIRRRMSHRRRRQRLSWQESADGIASWLSWADSCWWRVHGFPQPSHPLLLLLGKQTPPTWCS